MSYPPSTRGTRRTKLVVTAMALAVAMVMAIPSAGAAPAGDAGGSVAMKAPPGKPPAPPGSGCEAGKLRVSPGELGGIFLTGKPVRLSVHCIVGDEVRWSLVDFWGATAASGTAAARQGRADLRFQSTRQGHFTVEVQAYQGGAPTSSIARTEVAVVSPAGPDDGAKFGVQTHFGKVDDPGPYPLEVIPLIERLGVGGVRDSVRWEFVEKKKGKFHFDPHFTQYINKLAQAGLHPMITLALFNQHYDDGNTPYTDEGLNGFATYSRQIAKRYGAKLSAVEVWNEPNSQGFTRGPAARDPVNYAEMVRRVSRAVREVSDVPVFAGATTGIDLPWLAQAFEAGALDAADGVSVHHYPIDPTSRESDLGGLKDLLAEHGGEAKLAWASETGWPTFYPRDEALVARDLPKLLAIELDGGLDRVFWFNFMNNLAPPEEVPNTREVHFGLIRSQVDERGPYSPKPSYATYAALIRQLGEADPAGRDDTPAGIRSYAFRDGSQHVRVMWAGDENRYAKLSGGELELVDMMGNPVGQSVDGELLVKLTKDPVYVRGDVDAIEVRPIRAEAEALPATTAPNTTREQFNDPDSSGGRGDKYNGRAVGDFIEYDVDVPADGTYDIIVISRLHPSRGVFQLSVDGTPVGAPRDQFGGGGNRVHPIGSAALDAGTAKLRFTVVDKNAESSDFTLAFDYFELVPADPRRGVRYEAEALKTVAKTAGITEELFRDTAMSGTYGNKFNGHENGHFVEYEVDVPAPGEYLVVARAKAHHSRGIFQLTIDGVEQGDPQDHFGGCCYPSYVMGSKTFTSSGPSAFRFTVVGRNDASTDSTLALDYIELVPVAETIGSPHGG